MRICHIITRLIIGGAQENTILSCEGLAELGHEVSLVAGPQTGPEGSLWERAERGGYAVHRTRNLRREVNPFRDLRCLIDLTRLLRRIEPDVVHTHSSKAGILGRMAAERARVPILVHTIHGMSFNRTQSTPVRTFYRLLERARGRRTDRFVSVSDEMTRQAVQAGLGPAERFSTVYSGMEIDRYDPARYERAAARRALGFDEDAVVVGTVARLFAGKGYEQLLDVMPRCVEACPALRFVWVGDGPHRRRYLQRLAALGLRDRVHLTGLVPPERVPHILAGADMVVHLSQWEGLPRVLVQALLLEIPVISFDNDGAPEVNRPGETGELVALNDMQGLASAMIKLAEDEALRRKYGTRGRELCMERFDHRLMVRRLDETYAELAEVRKGRDP